MSGSPRNRSGCFWSRRTDSFRSRSVLDRRQTSVVQRQRVDLYTEFSNISGLARGAKVRVAGLDAGEVLEIQMPPNPDARFRVHFRASPSFNPFFA